MQTFQQPTRLNLTAQAPYFSVWFHKFANKKDTKKSRDAEDDLLSHVYWVTKQNKLKGMTSSRNLRLSGKAKRKNIVILILFSYADDLATEPIWA